jgi:hypothetical protein
VEVSDQASTGTRRATAASTPLSTITLPPSTLALCSRSFCAAVCQRQAGSLLLIEAAVRRTCRHAARSRYRQTHLVSLDGEIRRWHQVRVRVARAPRAVEAAAWPLRWPTDGYEEFLDVVLVEVDAIVASVSPPHLASLRGVCRSLTVSARVRVDEQRAVASLVVAAQRRHTVRTRQAATTTGRSRFGWPLVASRPRTGLSGSHARGRLGFVP